MNDLINKEKHKKKIFSKSLQIKEHASRTGDPVIYFPQIYEFFLNDLEESANHLYEKIIFQKKLKTSKLTPEGLRQKIYSELILLIPVYERTIQGYNMGGMLRNYDNFDEDKNQFLADAEERITDLSNQLYFQYRDSINKNKQQLWTYWAAIIGVLLGIISLIYTVISNPTIKSEYGVIVKSGVQH